MKKGDFFARTATLELITSTRYSAKIESNHAGC